MFLKLIIGRKLYWVEMVIGPKWSWAQNFLGRNDPETHDRYITSTIEMAARQQSLSPNAENEEDGEQRRETRRKYRELIQDLQGILSPS